MITCTLTITVKNGFQPEALSTLAEIERRSQDDPGRVTFQWLQDETDSTRFLLFEQWADQASLDAHLAKDPSLWEQFTPALDGDARPGRYLSVVPPTGRPGAAEVNQFVTTWFELLSAHVPVERLLPYLSTHGLEMFFPPDSTLTDEAEFRAWYASVGESFVDQTHTVEQVTPQPVPGTDDVDLDVVVIWRATQLQDGARLAARATQSWRLTRSPDTGRPVITGYKVLSLDDLEQAR